MTEWIFTHYKNICLQFYARFPSFLHIGWWPHKFLPITRARTRERSATRRLGRRARSLRRENHAHAEREREARREGIREDIQKRQREIEQEALFFDISFWRSDQVATQNYVLSEVSMCIATHDAKPLSEEELEMLSTAALAGPLLAATVTYVNEQIGSHNLWGRYNNFFQKNRGPNYRRILGTKTPYLNSKGFLCIQIKPHFLSG